MRWLQGDPDSGLLRRRPYRAVGRQADGDHRVNTDLAVQVEGAAMLFDQRFGERQAQSGAGIGAVERTFYLLEAGKRPGNVFGGDTNPGIGDLEHEAAVDMVPDPNRDRAIVLGKLNGIRQQIEDDLPDPSLVGA